MSRTTWFFMLFIMAMLAVGYYLSSHRMAGGRADVHFQIAFNLAVDGKHHKAIEELKTALQLDPKHELARGKLAEEYEVIGNYGDALAQWLRLLRETHEAQRAGSLRPPVTKLYTVHQHIGMCKLKMGDYKAALASFELALKTSPVKTELLLLTGDAHARLGQVKDAARQYLEVIQRAPQESEAYRKLAELYKEHKLEAKAKEVGERMKAAGEGLASEWEKLKKQYGW